MRRTKYTFILPFEVLFDSFNFPVGEEHVKLKWISEHENILIDYGAGKNASDLMLLAQAHQVLKKRGFRNIGVYLSHVPYARQDRFTSEFEPFSLKIFCDMLNTIGFDDVVIYHPHSDVAPALINNVTVINNHGFFNHVFNEINSKFLNVLSPDAGAFKTIFDTVFNNTHAKLSCNILTCQKMRNKETGKIIGIEVPMDNLDLSLPILIVDDLADGGRTFHEMAKVITNTYLAIEKTPELYLMISHGWWTKGKDNFNDTFAKSFNKVFVTSSTSNYNDVSGFKKLDIYDESQELKNLIITS